MAYLDASAVVKLVLFEAESVALASTLDEWPIQASSALARVEVLRVAARKSEAARERARRTVAGLTLLAIDAAILDAAAKIEPPGIRALDAIHLASAKSMGGVLGVVISYDRRMLFGAAALGLPTLSPE
ncbi:MAG: type II toxin-antitoxin system VapC family toxin [Solirubrobacteraceae bacterium]